MVFLWGPIEENFDITHEPVWLRKMFFAALTHDGSYISRKYKNHQGIKSIPEFLHVEDHKVKKYLRCRRRQNLWSTIVSSVFYAL